MPPVTSPRTDSHLRDLVALNDIWKTISEAEQQRIEQLAQRFAPDRGIVAYDNEEDDADTRLDHYDMPPLSDEDCEVLFADLLLGS